MQFAAVFAAVVGLAVPLTAMVGAMAQAKVGTAAMEGIARQPEAAGDIGRNLIIALALIESLVIYALLTFFIMQGKVGLLVEKIGQL
jgi:F-type H+-transporting ATPase subunit c